MIFSKIKLFIFKNIFLKNIFLSIIEKKNFAIFWNFILFTLEVSPDSFERITILLINPKVKSNT